MQAAKTKIPSKTGVNRVAEAEPATEVPAAAEMNHRDWMGSLEVVLEHFLKDQGTEKASRFFEDLAKRLRAGGVDLPRPVSTPYVNTISAKDEPAYPGNRELERRIKSLARWNAMAMVVNANRNDSGVGGHISSYASMATLYEVAYNHFYRGGNGEGRPADLIYFQGHTTPGNYARAFLEYRLDEGHLHNFRQELAEGGGLSSYPHPYLMPDFWQFPTVSMGLGPLMSIYQARFVRYLAARKLVNWTEEPKVWAYVGDGESDEPETLGSLTLASREKLDNLVWVVNCNLQRLDGPVRGNGKIIQELEGMFRGAGWNVIKVIWGSTWDELLAKDTSGLLVRRMEEAVDGDYQKYTVEPGSYIRKHFFGKYPELLRLVDHFTDDQLTRLVRGGHDPRKVYAAYKAAMEHKGAPTVILAKTVKGYGLGEAGEGRNISHQQKKMNEKELREFRTRFAVPLAEDDVVDTPFYRPPKDSPETKYVLERRKKLGGFVPARVVKAPPLKTPRFEMFAEFARASSKERSTTFAFAMMLGAMLRDKDVGRNIVPIIPDEARTFGLDPLFSQVGIYSSKGQLYEPADKKSTSYFYHETTDGQILEEGITEAGSMASFVAAGTAYANLGVNIIPFYIYYSMFGPQRVGDEVWLAGDSRTKGFMLGATSGRTTLNGEGLQHQDGHTPILASSVPNLYVYDPAFQFELAVIICDGMRRMFEEGEEIFYYLCLYNEGYMMPAMPEGCEEGIIKGLYKLKPGAEGKKHKAQIIGSGSIMLSALKAQEILASQYGVSADVWSATSYKNLRNEALLAERWNMLHPEEKPRKPYVQELLEKEEGPFIAVSDYMKIVPDQIHKWVPGGLTTLGTDGFGRSDIRSRLRRFFEVDAESTVVATLYALAQKGQIERSVVAQAIRDLKIDPEKAFPELVAF